MPVTVAPSPTGHPAYSETFRCVPASACDARRLIRTALFTWALDELADDAALVVSELVTNSVLHAPCRLIRVTVTRLAPETIRIGVVDKSPKFPVPCDPEHTATNGRGLAVIGKLTTRWGTDPLPWGKRVWGELDRRAVNRAQECAAGHAPEGTNR